MIELDQACKLYRRREDEVAALQPTTLEIGKGEYVALVGPSGSGKTTLLSLLGGMLAPTSGRVCLEGQSLYEISVGERARIRALRIGFVFQTFNLVPYLTAQENVQLPMFLAGWAAEFQRQRAAELLTKLGLAERMSHKPGELSIGQQQRVALARTLANEPALILADEPTGNLDPATREEILGFLDEFHAEGRTIVLVTHDPAAARRAGRVLSLDRGVVTAGMVTAATSGPLRRSA